MTSIVSENWPEGSCLELVTTRDVQPVQMIYDDEARKNPKPLIDVFPDAARQDDTVIHVYKLTIPKENKWETKDLRHQCRTKTPAYPCNVNISVTEAPMKSSPSPAVNKCNAAGNTLNLSA
ncbi:UNVERIFIED_CONTAM: hypothetical protein HHA_259280 [Hammondia hammondi]|eukprot:XP_008883076.1 hypothetical protein HHA_259280 [Hammondia hammondi]